MPYVYCNQLFDDDGNMLGIFSGHWPACAAMIRLSDSEFRSLGKEREDNLAVEVRIRESRK